MIIQAIGAFFAVLTISVVVGVPKRFLIYSGLNGAIGWWVYLLLGYYGHSEITKMFIATFVVALISHSFARVFKAPVTVFLIPGILPMVPGLGMYRTVYYLIRQEMSIAGENFIMTMQIAGMIALSIFIMDSCFRIFQKN